MNRATTALTALVVDIETELSTGHFVCTTNARAAAHIDNPPEIATAYHPGLQPEELVRQHAQAVSQAQSVDSHPCLVRTVQEAFEFSNRMQALKSNYLVSKGGMLGRHELLAITEGRYKRLVSEISRAGKSSR